MAKSGGNPFTDAASAFGEFKRSAALMVTGVNQLKELFNSLSGQVGALVKLYSPAHFRLFEIAASDASAALGRLLLPVMKVFTVIIRGMGDAFASIRPIFQILTLTAKDLEVVLRPLTQLFNALLGAAGKVFAALRPVVEMLAGVLGQALEALAGIIADITPSLVAFATQIGAVLSQLGSHFAKMIPLVSAFLKAVMQIGFAINGAMTEVLGAVLGLVLPALRIFAAVMSSIFKLLVPLVRIGLLPLQLALKALTPLMEVLAAVSDVLVTALDEVGTLLADLVTLLADDLGRTLRDLVTAVMPLVLGGVRVFTSAMMQMVKVIRFVADMVRNLFGLSPRDRGKSPNDTFQKDAGQGLAMREAQKGSIEEFINKAQTAAFSSGGGKEQSPTEKNTSQLQQATGKIETLNRLLERVIPIAERIANVTGAGQGVAVARRGAESGVFGPLAAIASRMVTG